MKHAYFLPTKVHQLQLQQLTLFIFLVSAKTIVTESISVFLTIRRKTNIDANKMQQHRFNKDCDNKLEMNPLQHDLYFFFESGTFMYAVVSKDSKKLVT